MAAKKAKKVKKVAEAKVPSRKCKRVFEESGKPCTRNALPDGEFCKRCQNMIKSHPAPAEEEWTLNVSKVAFISQMRDLGIATAGLEDMDQYELLEIYNNYDASQIQPAAANEAPPEPLVMPETVAGKSMLESWDELGNKRPLSMAKVPGKPGRFWVKPKDPRTIASKEISRMKLTETSITIYCIYGPKWTWERGEII